MKQSLIANDTFKNPILKEFFKDEENKELLNVLRSNYSQQQFEVLEYKFRLYLYEYRLIKYLSTLIHFYSLDSIKKYRQYEERYVCILNQENTETNEGTQLMDILVPSEESSETKAIMKLSSSLTEAIENQSLLKAIQSLPAKQRIIIYLLYIKQLKLKEVAHYYQNSTQNISKLHRKSLSQIKEKIEEYSYDR